MIKIVASLKTAIAEVRMALKELREMVGALEALLANPNVLTVDAFRKEALELIQSIKEKGK